MTTNRAAGAIASILLVLALIIVGAYFYNALCEPETVAGAYLNESGMVEMMEPTPNPNYVGGTKRQIYLFMQDALPSAQLILINNLEAATPGRMALCSVFLLTALLSGGVLAFRKKDLK